MHNVSRLGLHFTIPREHPNDTLYGNEKRSKLKGNKLG